MNEHKNVATRILCTMIILVLCFVMMSLNACTNQKKPTKDTLTEDTVRAADPMTEEEIEADDSDGCIEDSEDLLY